MKELFIAIILSDDIRPLKSPMDIKGGALFWIVIILILLIVGGIAAYVYFKKNKNIREKNVLAPRPAEEIARSALKALLELKLAEKGLIKEYYIRLSDIIRNYIENRFGIIALDKTTWELCQDMKIKKIKREHIDKISDFLVESDLVKFAKYVPALKEIEESYKKAEEIVEITTDAIR